VFQQRQPDSSQVVRALENGASNIMMSVLNLKKSGRLSLTKSKHNRLLTSILSFLNCKRRSVTCFVINYSIWICSKCATLLSEWRIAFKKQVVSILLNWTWTGLLSNRTALEPGLPLIPIGSNNRSLWDNWDHLWVRWAAAVELLAADNNRLK
jgi:hypothetical protein